VFEDYWAAVRKDNPDKVLQLLLAGFDPNTVDDKGNTALILSLSEGGLKGADVMLSLDQVEVNRVNRAGESALMVASRRGHEDMVRKLIAREATVNMTGWTPLHHAGRRRPGQDHANLAATACQLQCSSAPTEIPR